MKNQSPPSTTIVGGTQPNIPWESKPAGCPNVVWRYSRNPVIHRHAIASSNSIFDRAVVPFKDGFAGVFRRDDKRRYMQLHAGRSADGIHWQIKPDRIQFVGADSEVGQWEYGYDPRVCWIEDRYYVTWCNGYQSPTIGVACTHVFETFHQMENAFLPFNRDGGLFPRKIRGKYAMLSRSSDNGHTPFGDIYYSGSPDMLRWGQHRHVMSPCGGWQSTKIGAGPIPIETTEGWLLIYHGVLTSCSDFFTVPGRRCLTLSVLGKYCTERRVPVRRPHRRTDRPHYYGAADTVTGLAFATVDELIDFIKWAHPETEGN